MFNVTAKTFHFCNEHGQYTTQSPKWETDFDDL